MSPRSRQPSLFILIAAHNAADWYQRNLVSLFRQTYQQWRAVYIDDHSSDDTASRVEQFIAAHHRRGQVEVIRTAYRSWPARARQLACAHADPSEVICILDGDDWLADERALARVAAAYMSSDTICTYGRYKPWDGTSPSWSLPEAPIDETLVARVGYRKHPWVTSHMRTMLAAKLQSLPLADLLDHRGQWLKCCTDLAEMWWVLEQSEGRHTSLDEVVYIYNRVNSRRYKTSWYRRESEPAMARYRASVRTLLQRDGPRISACLAIQARSLARLADAVAHFETLPADLLADNTLEAVVIVSLEKGQTTRSVARRLSELGNRMGASVQLRAFCSQAPGEQPVTYDQACAVGSGQVLMPLRIDERPSAAELRRILALPEKDECLLENLGRSSSPHHNRHAIGRRRFFREGGPLRTAVRNHQVAPDEVFATLDRGSSLVPIELDDVPLTPGGIPL